MRTSIFLAIAIALGAAGCDRQTPSQPEPPAPTAATPAAPAGTASTGSATTGSSGAGQPGATPATQPAPAAAATMAQARVALKPTQNNTANGSLVLESDGGTGVHVHGTIEGLSPNSTHGFHIHENGDCSAPDATSAGGHFNPDGKPHGDPSSEEHHVGDIFSVNADANGVGQVDARADRASLGDGSATDVLGKAVIVHEKADDYRTQPTGDAGGRIACGVIQ